VELKIKEEFPRCGSSVFVGYIPTNKRSKEEGHKIPIQVLLPTPKPVEN
jgi:hypothetical protein